MHRWATVVIAAVVVVALLSACSSDVSGTVVPRPSGPGHAAAAVPKATIPAAPPALASSPRPDAVSKPVNRCARNDKAQKVIVSVRTQHAWMCARHRAVYDTAVTTGMLGQSTSTPTGNYEIEARNTNTVLTLNTGAQYDVRYWIPFDSPLFGFHDSAWQHFPYGSARYKTHGSHGCIHLPLKAMAWLYRWVAEPTAVHIA